MTIGVIGLEHPTLNGNELGVSGIGVLRAKRFPSDFSGKKSKSVQPLTRFWVLVEQGGQCYTSHGLFGMIRFTEVDRV
jgi:hypothetical protein